MKQIIFTFQCLCIIWLNIAIIIQRWRDEEVPATAADLSINNSQSLKNKPALLGKTANAVNNTDISIKDAKIVVPLKYFE